MSDRGEGGEGGVVGFGEGVEVFLGGDDAAVSEAFFDGLQVGAAGEEPGGVGVAQVVGADADADAGGVEGGFPDVVAEPGAGDVTVGGEGAAARGAGCWVWVFAGGSSFGSVGGVGAAAVFAFAAAGVVAGEGAVAILPSCGVRLGQPEVDRLGDELQVRRLGWGEQQRRGEQQIVGRKLMVGDVGLELVGDVGGELDAAVLAVFGVVLDQEPATGGVELGDEFDRDPADGEHPHPRVQVERVGAR